MNRAAIAGVVAAVALSGTLLAQGISNPGGVIGAAGVDASTVSSMISSAIAGKADVAAIPVAGTAVPVETVGGSMGTTTATFMRSDAKPARITRTAACTIAISGGVGSCDATWDGSSFAAGTTIRLAGSPAVTTATVGAAAEQPMTCKAYNLSVTGISFRCWQAQQSVLSLAIITAGLTLLPFAAPSAVTVQVTALPSS